MKRPIEHPVAIAVEGKQDEGYVELLEKPFGDEPLVKRLARRAEGIDHEGCGLPGRGEAM